MESSTRRKALVSAWTIGKLLTWERATPLGAHAATPLITNAAKRVMRAMRPATIERLGISDRFVRGTVLAGVGENKYRIWARTYRFGKQTPLVPACLTGFGQRAD